MGSPHHGARTPEEAAAIADAMQASYYRGFFESQRDARARDLAGYVRTLTQCTTTGDMRAASRVRRTIRHTQRNIHAIERMLQALKRKIPGDLGG
jgi:hypothetical protein